MEDPRPLVGSVPNGFLKLVPPGTFGLRSELGGMT
jgi:hypothetical protein